MNNTFSQKTTLDVTNDYPTGLLHSLPVYSDSQEYVNNQITYTANNNNIVLRENAAYANTLNDIRNTGIIPPNSYSSSVLSVMYKNAASSINAKNSSELDSVNIKYKTAKDILVAFREISHSAYLTFEASKIYTKLEIDSQFIKDRGSYSDIHSNNQSIIVNTELLASDASLNTSTSLTNTIRLIENTIDLTSNISSNLILSAAFNTIVKSVAKTLYYPLYIILGKGLLNTPSQIIVDVLNNNKYSSNIPIDNALQISSNVLECINAFISSIADSSGLTPEITNSIDSALTLANNLFLDAKSVNTNISYTTASNANEVYNALNNLKIAYSNILIVNSTISPIVLSSLDKIIKMLISINNVITNKSSYNTISIINREFNNISRELDIITYQETESIEYAANIKMLYTLLSDVLPIANSTIATSEMSTQQLFWQVKNISEESEKQYKIIKDHMLLLDRTTNYLVTPSSVSLQTYAAHVSGTNLNNIQARISRASINPPRLNPLPFQSFKADIRVKDRLIPKYKSNANFNYPNTIQKVINTVTKETQYIKDMSNISLRLQ